MKKLKKDNIAVIVLLVLVGIYIFYECYSATHVKLETTTAVTSTVYEKIDATALAVRNEHLLSNSDSGVTSAAQEDGAKIKSGGIVGMVFSSSDEAADYSKYIKAKKELDYYNDLKSQSVGQAANVESINDDIENLLLDYILSTKTNADIDDASSELNGSLIKRQLIIGEDVDFSSITGDLQSTINKYSASAPKEYIKTDSSGVFSSYTDGCESIADWENIEEITAAQLEKALNTAQSDSAKTVSSSFGKLITSYEWYLVAEIDADSAKSLSNGKTVTVALKEDNTTLDMQIVSGADPKVGADKTVLVLKSSNLDADLARLRTAEIEIRYKTYTGIKVPAEALHVKNGKKGVYALVSSQVKFRQADVIFTDDDYVLLSYDKDSADGIRLYDKIITRGKDLEDGKVYT